MINKKKVIFPVVVLLAGLLAAVLLVQARPDVPRVERTAELPRVLFTEALPRDLQLEVHSQGNAQARVESDLVAEVAGTVHWTSPEFVAGGFVRLGQPILRLDPRDNELTLRSQQAGLAQATVMWEREQAEADIARREWQDLGRGEASPLVLREPQLREAEARVAAAEAAVERAQLDLERCTVRAPFTGRVRSKRIDVGEFVTRGAPLATLYSVDAVEINLPVPNEELRFLDQTWRSGRGPEVRLTTEFAGETVEWHGRVVRTGGEIDPNTRMVQLIARVDDPYGLRHSSSHPPLQVGLFVAARISGREVSGIVVLPRSALHGESGVLVIDENDRLHSREVSLLRVLGDQILVASGLTAGERVAIAPVDIFVDGMAVRPVQGATGAALTADPLAGDRAGMPPTLDGGATPAEAFEAPAPSTAIDTGDQE